jgi:hypothetical protein
MNLGDAGRPPAMEDNQLLVILIAPNVSEQMGGEAIKALQIFREIKKLHPRTVQITHERCRAELIDRLALPDIYLVNDTSLSIAMWKSKIFRAFLDPRPNWGDVIDFDRGVAR